jgi:hypothetical protein
MKKILYKLKPESGLASVFHILLNALMPILILVFVRLDLLVIAIVLVLLAKWRVVAVKPRYWFANIRANLVDIFVGLSVVAFIAGTHVWYTQVVWVALYMFWLVWLKAQSKPLAVMAQALVAQALGLVAFYRAFPGSSIAIGIIAAWAICYACARHFLGAFEEVHQNVITNIWAWFSAIMAWILGHWVIDYLFLPQIALVLSVLGYGLATMYYLHSKNRLSPNLKRQLIAVMGILLLIIIVFSDWQDKTI